MTKTSKKSVIVSAVLAIALCVSLAVGATFALFTSESPVNIAVTSGKVKIEATISDLNAYSPTTIAQDSDNTITNADNAAINSGDTHQFANGGTVSVEGNEIKIVNITSGDKVTFKITITNYSNVKAKYRTTVQKGNDDGLYAGLKFNIGGLYVESSTLWTDLATVTDTENGEVVAEYTCTVELPANAGNTYQGKSCSIAYNVEAVQGNAETVNDSESSNITTEATETVTTTKDANNNTVVAQEVSIVSKDSIAVSENQTVSAAKATVPANVQLDENADSLTLSVKETDVPSNITVVDTATQDAKNFDIKVTGVSENNQEPITVSVYVGKGLSGVAVYHTHGDSTTEMEDAVYDAATGILTIKTANFSDFTIVYDANTKVVYSADELVKALEDGRKCIKVTSDIKTDNIGDTEADRIIISNSTTLNLDAKVISPDDMGNNNTNFCALIVDANTVIHAGKNGGIDTGKNGGYAINVRNGANLTINGGNYYGGGTAVQVQKGTLTITGGHFAVEAFDEPYGYKYLLNCIDSAYKSGDAKIIVMGGTFVNFDPSNNASEGAGTSYVADGYTVISETQPNGDIWYTVVPGASVSTADELVSAITNANEGDTIVLADDITISPEEYNVKNRLNVETDNLTIDLNGKTLTVSNYTLILDGDNITLMNGEMMTTTINSSQTYGSYAVVPHGKNIIITGVKMLGGVNVTGDNSGNAERDTTVTITNCEITATNYYTVCAQSNAEATIENTKLIGGAGTFFWVEEKGYSEGGAPLAKVSSKIIYDAETVVFDGNNGLYNPVGVAVVAKNLTVKDAEGKEQTIDAVAVSTEAHLRTLVAAGENVMLASDITLTAPITIGTTSTNNTTIAIVGNGHKLDGSSITSGKEPRAINVWDGTNMTVILNDLTVIGPEAASGRGITTGGTKGLTLILDDCEVSASYYAINVYEDANNVYNPKVIVRNTTLKNVSGYCAINIWAQGTNATFENCTLIGVNNWSGTSDDFATIVINATAKNSTLTFKNCTIKAIEQGTAKEYLYDVRSGATGAKVTFDGCTFFVNGTEVTGDAIQSNMKTQIDTSLTIK